MVERLSYIFDSTSRRSSCRDSKCASVELALSYGEVKFLSGVQDMSCFRGKLLGMAELISSYEGVVLFRTGPCC